MALYLVSIFVHVALDGLAMQVLIQIWVLRIHIDLTVLELKACWRLLVEDDLQGNLLSF